MSIPLAVHVAQERLLGYQQVNISASTSFRRSTWISLAYLIDIFQLKRGHFYKWFSTDSNDKARGDTYETVHAKSAFSDQQ